MEKKDTHGPQSRLGKPAAEVCKNFELSEAGGKLLNDKMSAHALLKTLQEHKLYADAIRLSAYALDKRDAIWWGSMCLWQIFRADPAPDVAAAMQTVVLWVRKPGEELRRSAEEAGKKLKPNHPVAGLTQAVFLSGGSISKPKLPEVEPKPELYAKRIASVVMGASRMARPTPDIQKQFVELAHSVADGKLSYRVAKK